MQDGLERVLDEKFRGKITPNPTLPSGRKADYKVNVCGRNVYFEHKDIKDITSDIIEKTPYQGKHVKEIIEIPTWAKDPRKKKTLLDKIAGKILGGCKQLPEKESSVLVIEASDPWVSCDDIGDALLGVHQFITERREKGEILKPIRHPYYPFRTPEELDKVLRKISALIAYDAPCTHGKLKGKIYINSKNADVPLLSCEKTQLEDLICDKCEL